MSDDKQKLEMDVRDIFAFQLLKDFIVIGYPALDPAKQVDAAYQYAGLMVERRKQ